MSPEADFSDCEKAPKAKKPAKAKKVKKAKKAKKAGKKQDKNKRNSRATFGKRRGHQKLRKKSEFSGRLSGGSATTRAPSLDPIADLELAEKDFSPEGEPIESEESPAVEPEASTPNTRAHAFASLALCKPFLAFGGRPCSTATT
jgi:hypothetical protein